MIDPVNSANAVRCLERIAHSLESIADSLRVVVDYDKRVLRMEDVERGKVYSSHLGKKLRTEPEGEPVIGNTSTTP
jgi:hypothetical protein